MKRTIWILALALCSCTPGYRPDEHGWRITQKNQYDRGEGAWYLVHEVNTDSFWIKSNNTTYQVGDVLNICKTEEKK